MRGDTNKIVTSFSVTSEEYTLITDNYLLPLSSLLPASSQLSRRGSSRVKVEPTPTVLVART